MGELVAALQANDPDTQAMAVWRQPRPRATSRDGAGAEFAGPVRHQSGAGQACCLAPGSQPLARLEDPKS